MPRPPKLNRTSSHGRDRPPELIHDDLYRFKKKESDPTLVVILAIVGCVLLLLFMFLIGGLVGSGSASSSKTEQRDGTESGTQVAQESAEDESVDSLVAKDESVPETSKPTTVKETSSPQTADETRLAVETSEEMSEQPIASGESGDGKVKYFIGGGSFFGIRAQGNRFVYVVDCSGSMKGARLSIAKKELRRSINELGSEQSFSVYFFANDSFPMFYPQPNPTPLVASPENKQKVIRWIDNFDESGGTEPEDSLLEALQLEPDAIYLLTDGEFSNSTVNTVSRANSESKVIHTIGFRSRSGEPLLKELAERNRGIYRFVKN